MILVVLAMAATPEARLAEIRQHFSVAALEELARASPSTEAGGEAAAWRGALALQARELDVAARWFTQAAASAGEGRRQGERGLGDVAMAEHRYGDARARFQAASVGASGVLAAELEQKVALAARFGLRQHLEWAAWLLVCAALAYFVARAWRGSGPLRPPLEAVYVLPLYLLLILGALGREPAVVHALILGAVISSLFVFAAGLAGRRAPPSGRLRWLHAGLVVVANLALFYAVLNRTGLVDSLVMTAQM
jgi:hypothetical protein